NIAGPMGGPSDECGPPVDECAPLPGCDSTESPEMSQLFGSVRHGAPTAGIEQLFGSIARNGSDSGRGAIADVSVAAPITVGSTVHNDQRAV
ncbi:MAG: hypothetical protein ACRDTD_28100, partial [Pseudonocardiaceae bacterium]